MGVHQAPQTPPPLQLDLLDGMGAAPATPWAAKRSAPYSDVPPNKQPKPPASDGMPGSWGPAMLIPNGVGAMGSAGPMKATAAIAVAAPPALNTAPAPHAHPMSHPPPGAHDEGGDDDVEADPQQPCRRQGLGYGLATVHAGPRRGHSHSLDGREADTTREHREDSPQSHVHHARSSCHLFAPFFPIDVGLLLRWGCARHACDTTRRRRRQPTSRSAKAGTSPRSTARSPTI